jgi:uncharacterized protein
MQALITAIKAGDFEAVRVALQQNPDLIRVRPEQGPSSLLFAVYYNKPQIAAYLIEQGAPVDLFEASALGLLDQASQLLERRPEDINVYGRDGFQPLGLASFFGHTDLVRLFLDKGANVNTASRNTQRVTPLHSAVAGQHLEITKSLLHQGADVNAVQEGGFTPLHGAAQNGQLEILELLLAAGADPRTPTDDGKTSFEIASEAGHLGIAERFRAWETEFAK